MMDLSLHRQILLNILKDIFQNSRLAPVLGFKGGTCLYFFYDLTRFSVDLDFNLLGEPLRFEPPALEAVLKKHIAINDFWSKENTWLWMGSYQKTHRQVKIEISKRRFPDEYELKDLYGLPVQCMKPAFLFAHKLCAIQDRSSLANRDLFDAHFMFSKNFPVADAIIRERTGKDTEAYFRELAVFLSENANQRGILDGLGELLTPEQKQWVKNNLMKELLFYLMSYRKKA